MIKTIIKKFSILLNRDQKIKLLFLEIASIIGAAFEVLSVTLMIPLVTAVMQPDIIYTNRTIAGICTLFDISSHRSFVLLCIFALIILFALKNIYLLVEYYLQARFVYNNQFKTTQELLHSYMCRSYEYYINVDSGRVLRNISGDVSDTYSLLLNLLRTGAEFTISLGLIITICLIEPTMTLSITFIMTVVVLVIIKVVKPILAKKGAELRDNTIISNRWLIQSVEGIKEIKVGRRESFFEKNFEKAAKKTNDSSQWYSVFYGIPRLMIEAFSVCTTLMVIAIMIYNGKPLEDLIPALAAFVMAAVKLLPAANRIVSVIGSISYAMPSVDALIDNLKADDNVHSELYEKVTNDISINDKIEMKNISYTYPNSDRKILDNVSFEIPVGKSVGIVGVSGGGKTTSADIILGLLDPQEGEIISDGKNIKENYPSWLDKIGYIPQSIYLLNGTIKDNIAFGCEADDAKVWKALEEAQLADFVRTLPYGLDSNVGERGIKLSGGQRQRIGIARALYTDPVFLIFDEATSALDNETEAAIMESIERFHGKKTMMIIAHRLQTIEHCDIVYRIENAAVRRER